MLIAALIVLPTVFLGLSRFGLASSFIVNSLFVFLMWVYVRWVASTAEKAGRSYVGFMLVAILFAPIAWIIVLLFQKPQNTPSSS